MTKRLSEIDKALLKDYRARQREEGKGRSVGRVALVDRINPRKVTARKPSSNLASL